MERENGRERERERERDGRSARRGGEEGRRMERMTEGGISGRGVERERERDVHSAKRGEAEGRKEEEGKRGGKRPREMVEGEDMDYGQNAARAPAAAAPIDDGEEKRGASKWVVWVCGWGEGGEGGWALVCGFGWE